MGDASILQVLKTTETKAADRNYPAGVADIHPVLKTAEAIPR